MRERINWIDWAKFMAITLVVLGHIPLERGHPLNVYIYYFHMPFFMFLSGYLTKRRPTLKENLKKDWVSIVRPYLLYNAAFYPYWVVRKYVESSADLSVFEYVVKPVLGVLFFQIDTPVSSNVSGPTWFLAALVLIHVIIDIGNKLRLKRLFWVAVAVAGLVFYVLNEQHVYTPNMTIIGLAKCFPFYLIGYLLYGKIRIEDYSRRTIWTTTVAAGVLSVAVTAVTLQPVDFWLRMGLIFVIIPLAITFFVGLSMALDGVRWSVVTNISIGTLVIFGLHWMVIGTLNFVLQKLLGIPEMIYSTWQAVLLAFAIEALLYPLIKLLPPMWLGKRKEVLAQIK